MKKLIAHLSPIHHRGEKRIKVEMPFEKDAIAKIKTVEGRRWSQTKKCWHVPYTRDAYGQLQQLFELKHDESLFPVKSENEDPVPSRPKKLGKQPGKEVVHLEKENDARLKAFVPPHRKDWIEIVKKIDGRAWNEHQKYWSLPNVKATCLYLKKELGKALKIGFKVSEDIPETYQSKYKKELPKQAEGLQPSFQTIQQEGREIKIVTGNFLVLEKVNEEWFNAFVPFDKKGWIETVKNIPGRKWNVEEKCWVIPNVKDSYRMLKSYVGMENLRFNFEISTDIPEEWVPPRKKRKGKTGPELNEMQRRALTALEEKLILENKRWRTIKTYRNCLRALLLFHPQTRPSQITARQIQQYMVYQIKAKNISFSSRNQIINSLNAFFVRVADQPEKVQVLERPKKQRRLPNVVSPEEIKILLESVENLKHKTMLILIYSAGLRKGELLRLRKQDLSFARQSLFVKDGKGGKDRYTFLSPTAIKYVKEYLKTYAPKYWLFEGQTGGQYSETSLQKVFDKARKKSGVNPYLTIHGLRHSFATHLVEKRVPLHVVKDLLGHVHLDTTEVYLHISQKFRKEIESPLEGLNL